MDDLNKFKYLVDVDGNSYVLSLLLSLLTLGLLFKLNDPSLSLSSLLESDGALVSGGLSRLPSFGSLSLR